MTNGKIQPADYSYWLKVKDWGTYEAANLLLGIEPRSLHSYPNDLSAEQRLASDQIDKLKRVLDGAVDAGDFGKVIYADEGRTIAPATSGFEWVDWAKRNGIDCAEELLNAVAETKEQDDSEADDIHPRRETTLLRVIGALLQELKESTDQSQANIIKRIDDQHGHKSGISKSQLENDFAEANRRLKDW